MKLVLHHIAEKYLLKLNAVDRNRIEAAINGLEKKPPEGDICSYEGTSGVFRLKISGGFRALFKIYDNVIHVTHIEPRGQAYTKKTRNKRG
jgi:mRNA-degrading endonuclease RelE of RelBE toxin-antitoxin system